VLRAARISAPSRPIVAAVAGDEAITKVYAPASGRLRVSREGYDQAAIWTNSARSDKMGGT
jgi:hypothetical protein